MKLDNANLCQFHFTSYWLTFLGAFYSLNAKMCVVCLNTCIYFLGVGLHDCQARTTLEEDYLRKKLEFFIFTAIKILTISLFLSPDPLFFVILLFSIPLIFKNMES